MSHDLPPPDVQEGLLAALGELIATQGHAPLVQAPLVEATPRFFPDAWTPDEHGARVLALRLLAHAGLEHLDVALEVFETEEQVSWTATAGSGMPGISRQKHGAAAWFRGFDGDFCLFGVERSGMADPEALVATLAHEVAHAYRMHHGLMVEDPDVEEELTDLTTVYLGFGILTVNGAYRYRSSGGVEGAYGTLEWSFARAGYLPLEAMSFLLAAQVVVRRMDSSEQRHVLKQLERNQAASFRAALKLLEPQRESLSARLHVPPPERWGRVRLAGSVPEPRGAEPVRWAPGMTVQELAGEPPPNEGRPVFRIPSSSVVRGLLFAALGILPAYFLDARLGLEWAWWLPLGLGLVGLRFKRDLCSGTDCDAVLPARAVTCRKCGGTVAGSIRTRRDKHDAEAEYWREVRARKGSEALPEDALEDEDAPWAEPHPRSASRS